MYFPQPTQRLTLGRTPNISATTQVLPDHLQIVEQRLCLFPCVSTLNALWPAAFRRRATQHAPRTSPRTSPHQQTQQHPEQRPHSREPASTMKRSANSSDRPKLSTGSRHRPRGPGSRDAHSMAPACLLRASSFATRTQPPIHHILLPGA